MKFKFMNSPPTTIRVLLGSFLSASALISSYRTYTGEGIHETGTCGERAVFAPGFLIYIVFMMIPIGMSIYYSFHNWDGLSPTYQFIGTENFVKALTDENFHRALKVTMFITIVGTLCTNALGIFFAVLLNKPGKAYESLSIGVLFPTLAKCRGRRIFVESDSEFYNGVLNSVLEKLSLPKLEVFGTPDNAVLTITLIIIWQSLGGVIVLYLAGLQSIPRAFIKQAKINAYRWQAFRNVTFPMLAPSVTMCIIFIFSTLAREYDRIAVLTNGGAGGTTETAAFMIVRLGINTNRFSYASALAVILLVIVAAISIVMTLYLRKREERIS